MCSSTEYKTEKRAGAVLLMVLGFILLTSWMLVQALERVRAEIALRGIPEQNEALQASAFQALEILIAVLAEVRELDGALYSPSQGWGDPLAYAGFAPAGPLTNAYDETVGRERTAAAGMEIAEFAFSPGIEVDVAIRDESGRLPLNQTPAARWELLFEAMDIQRADADTLTDSLLDWIDADSSPRINGAETELYQRRDPPYLPTNGPVTDLDQLRLIEGYDRLFFDEHGLPNERFRTFRECVSTVSTGPVNYNTAPPLVLEVLAKELDFEATRITDYLNGADQVPGSEDDGILRPGLTEADMPLDGAGDPLDFSTTCRYLTVRVTARSADTVFELGARLDTATRPPQGLYPMTIFDLRQKGTDL